jgi:hypothetical protein
MFPVKEFVFKRGKLGIKATGTSNWGCSWIYRPAVLTVSVK